MMAGIETTSSQTLPGLAQAPHRDPNLDSETEPRLVNSRYLGLWIFLATVSMLFAGLASALLVRRAAPDWQVMEMPWRFPLNTGLLLASSVALELSMYRRRIGLVAASLLGLGFLIGQGLAWQDLAGAGHTIPTGPHTAFLYLLTGLHAVHLLAAQAVLTWITWRACRGGLEDGGDLELVNLGRMFWHFLAALWLLLLALLFIQ